MDVTTEKRKNVTTRRARNISLNLRVTKEEKREIERCASVLGMNQTELILNGVGIISGMIEKHRENRRAKGGERSGT
ncbi:MAG: DUF1778 domain-containing protein [Acetatifactor sp.]|nr:DUF1778 domain-containing protein [Acetatifactor sp.]